jgi:hypothetical protein
MLTLVDKEQGQLVSFIVIMYVVYGILKLIFLIGLLELSISFSYLIANPILPTGLRVA